MPSSAIHTREVILAFFSWPPAVGRRASKEEIKLLARHKWPGWRNPEPTMDRMERAISIHVDSCRSLTKCADIKATKLFSHLIEPCLAGVENPEEQESRVSVSQGGVES